MADEREPQSTQTVHPEEGEPFEIPVPTRGEFDRLVKKVAGPGFRKQPDETVQPPERSG